MASPLDTQQAQRSQQGPRASMCLCVCGCQQPHLHREQKMHWGWEQDCFLHLLGVSLCRHMC